MVLWEMCLGNQTLGCLTKAISFGFKFPLMSLFHYAGVDLFPLTIKLKCGLHSNMKDCRTSAIGVVDSLMTIGTAIYGLRVRET